MKTGLRIDRRALLGGLALAPVPVITACAPDRADAPAVTRQQAQDLQDSYAHRLFEATRTRDRELLRTIETGPLLDRDLATMDLGDRLHAPKTAEEYTLPHTTGYPVRSTTATDQRQLITVSDYSNTRPAWRDLALYVRTGPAGAWLRTYGAGVYAADVPHFGQDHPLTPVPPSATGYVASPTTVPGIVAKALADPSSPEGELLGSTEVSRRYAATLAATRQQAARIGSVTRSYRPGTFLIAIAVDSGYLALGSFDYDETLTARRGRHLSFVRRSAERRAFPGHYRTATASYGAMFAAVVPTDGKMRLISGEQRQTGLTVA